MVLRPFAVLLVALTASVFAQDANAPEALLARGVASLRAGDAASAVPSLDAALGVWLGSDPAATYVSTGRLDALPSVETALVYLTLAQFRLGLEDEARDTLLRLFAAERIAPTYATLSLGADATDFETLAKALVPLQSLPRNGELPPDDGASALPALVPKHASAGIAARQELMDALLGDFVHDTPAPVPAPVMAAAAPRANYSALREADIAAENGDIATAVTLYTQAIAPESVPREVLIAAGTGLYRTAAFRDAAQALRRIGTFARGEEDLRYYYAVSLYESGDYAAAQKELTCALPFIVATDEVLRYKNKIELTLASK